MTRPIDLCVGILAAVLACHGSVASASGEPTAPGPKVAVANPTGKTLRNVPVTLGQVFVKGQIRQGVVVKIGDTPLPAQIDVKRRYDDGSVRLAVISAIFDGLRPQEGVALTLCDGQPSEPNGTPLSGADLLQSGFDAAVALTFPDGAVRSTSVRRLLEKSADAKTWLRGPVATEWLLSGPPMGQDGKPDEDLNVQFQVRAYRRGGPVRVSVVVENCSDHWARNIRYDVAVTVNGREVYSKQALDHRRLSRWRKVFWTGDGDGRVHVAHDLTYLALTGAVPNYDRTLPEVEPTWETAKHLRMEGPDWDILGQGPLTAYMPTTGGRPEIGPYPSWTVRCLLSMTPEAKALVLCAGDLAGSWPIHVRSLQTGRIMTIDQRPEFWLDERGKDRPEWKADRHAPDAKQVQLSPDLAHQPSLAYVPYLLTGDYYYLEEAYFWANYCLLATWPHPRQNARGILADQIRGDAWALRNMADAAWIAADGDPEGRYFDEKVRNTLADRVQKMLGPPEYNRMGFWGVRTVEDARIQNPANPRWLIVAPWEHDYLAWSLHHLVELGYPEAAKCRDFLLRWRIGLLTHAPDYDPMLATPYRLVVGEKGADGKEVFYEDWRRLGAENARLSKPDLPNYGNSYAYSARAAAVCGTDGGVPKAREAVEWLEEHLRDFRRVMAEDPIGEIVPGGAAARP